MLVKADLDGSYAVHKQNITKKKKHSLTEYWLHGVILI